jgi:hypothetical protein
VVIYFHGNAESCVSCQEFVEKVRDTFAATVYVVEYPGTQPITGTYRKFEMTIVLFAGYWHGPLPEDYAFSNERACGMRSCSAFGDIPT